MPRKSKPGPKSSKPSARKMQPEKIHPAADLGDTDASSLNETDRSFLSPEPNIDDTDYGLPFSHSMTLRSPSQRHRSVQGSTPKQTRPQQQKQTNARQQGARRRKQMTPQQRDRRLLHEIAKLQNRTDFLIPRLPFSRLVREIIMEFTECNMMITKLAFEALQEATEMYVVQRLHDAYLLTMHRQRVTLTRKDLELLHFLKPT